MNANQHKSVAKDQMILSVHRFRRRSWIVSFLICENLRIDRSDQIIFPTLDPNPGDSAFGHESTQIGRNRLAIVDGSSSYCVYLRPFASICG